MSLPENRAAGQTGHIGDHNAVHDLVNTVDETAVRLPLRVPEMLSKYAHVHRDHGQVQAAIADTSGATLAALEAEVNKLKAVLRAQGAILP